MKIFKKNSLLTMMLDIGKLKPILIPLIIFLSVVKGIFPSIEIFIVAKISNILIDYSNQKLSSFLILFLMLFIIRVSIHIIDYINGLLSQKISNSIDVYLKTNLMKKAQNVDFRYREQGDYANKLIRAQGAIDPSRIIYIILNIPETISKIVSIVSILIILLSLKWIIAAISLVTMILCSFLIKKSSKIFFDSIRNSSEEERMLSTFSSHMFNSNTLAELRVYNKFNWMMDIWENFGKKFYKYRRKKIQSKKFCL